MAFPHHEELYLSNFTTFAEAKFTFSPTINVLVGENGTGKTHLMKVLYAVQYTCSRDGQRGNLLPQIVGNVFQIPTVTGVLQSPSVPGKFQDAALVRQSASKVNAYVTGKWKGNLWDFGVEDFDIFGYSIKENSTHPLPEMPRPIFIPAIDMMGHTRRFLSTYDEYQIDFDQTHRDIVALLLAPERRNPPQNPETAELLAGLLGGKVEEENERFYLRTPEGRQPMPLVAEGLRKIATLYQLIRNGFLEPGSVLFWDEPEVNVNPKLMDEIVDVLLRLARSGVQIFLSTHSYVILK